MSGGNHFGSRGVFARDGTLFVTQGDRFAYRDKAQDLAVGYLLTDRREGRILRVTPAR